MGLRWVTEKTRAEVGSDFGSALFEAMLEERGRRIMRIVVSRDLRF